MPHHVLTSLMRSPRPCPQAAITAALSNLSLDSSASTWSLENFAVAVATHRPALSWAAVAERLDCPGFSISSETAFRRLVSHALMAERPPCQARIWCKAQFDAGTQSVEAAMIRL